MKQGVKRSMVLLAIGLMYMPNGYGIDPMAPPGYGNALEALNADEANMPLERTTRKRHSEYELQQIVIKPNHKSAVINDELVNEGDQLGKAKVISISAEGVEINVNGKRKRLTLENDYPTIKVRNRTAAER